MNIKWKKFLILMLTAALLGANLRAFAEEVESRRFAVLSVSGDEAFITKGSAREVKAVAGMPVGQGSSLRTGKSTRLYLETGDSKTIRLDGSSQAEITKSSAKSLKLTLKSGALFFNVDKPLKEDEEMSIDAARTSMSIRGTSGILEFSEGKLVFYLVEGKVSWNLDGQELMLEPGQKAVLTENGQGGYALEGIGRFTWEDLSGFGLESVLDQREKVDLSVIGLENMGELGKALEKEWKQQREFYGENGRPQERKIIKTEGDGRGDRGGGDRRTAADERGDGTSAEAEPTSREEPGRNPSDETGEKEPGTGSETETSNEESGEPTKEPDTEKPTDEPITEKPSETPSSEPTKEPTTERPTEKPPETSSAEPTKEPATEKPTETSSTETPSGEPTKEPTTEKPTETSSTEPDTAEPDTDSTSDAPSTEPSAPEETTTEEPASTDDPSTGESESSGESSKEEESSSTEEYVSDPTPQQPDTGSTGGGGEESSSSDTYSTDPSINEGRSRIGNVLIPTP